MMQFSPPSLNLKYIKWDIIRVFYDFNSLQKILTTQNQFFWLSTCFSLKATGRHIPTMFLLHKLNPPPLLTEFLEISLLKLVYTIKFL